MTKLEELKELCLKATRGAWQWGVLYNEWNDWRVYSGLEAVEANDLHDVMEWDDRGISIRQRDAAFVEAFNPQVALKLLSCVQAARKLTSAMASGDVDDEFEQLSNALAELEGA